MDRREAALSTRPEDARPIPTAPALPKTVALTPPAPDVTACANCGAPLAGPYCAQCGQHVADYHRSVWRFLIDFLDNTFCWDNKLKRTLVPLFGQPGFLTREFMAGRRVRYVHPLKMFLFTSAVCLALLHVDMGRGSKHLSVPTEEKSAKPARADGKPQHGLTFDFSTSPTPADGSRAPAGPSPAIPPPAASVLAEFGLAPSPSPAADTKPKAGADADDDDDSPAPSASPPAASTPDLDAAALAATVKKAIKGKVGEKQAADISRAIEEKVSHIDMKTFGSKVTENFQQRLSWLALGLLPVFAFMLRALYWRRDAYYFLHLVFSLHYHTFLLMFWTLYTWTRALLEGTFLHGLAILGLLAVPWYLYAALRRVYGGSPRRTWTKVCLLGGMHLLAIVMGLAAVGALAVFSAVG